ncbi:MAG: translocation/assembly module TamB domain-containing protein [Rhodospirillaceae bacterium]|nr:translocation/assembly module TamB domain-containing protein [Rhodospirillaceae bacterium]
MAASSGPNELRIAEISGFVPFDIEITGIALADAEGVWLTVDRVAVAWLPSALLLGRAEIDHVTIGTVDVARLPRAGTSMVDDSASGEPDTLTLPSLPIAIDLRALTVARLALGTPILGEPATFEAAAQASLGDIDRGLSLKVDLRRLDGGADLIDVALDYIPANDHLAISAQIHAPDGGLLARSVGLPAGNDLDVDAFGEGPLSDWQGYLTVNVEGQPLATVTGHITGAAADRLVAVEMVANPQMLVSPEMAPLMADGVRLSGEMGIGTGFRTVDIHQLTIDSAAAVVSLQGRFDSAGESDGSFSIVADNADVFSALLPDVGWREATVEGRLRGAWPAMSSTITASATDLTASGNRIGIVDLGATLDGRDMLAAPIAFDAILDLAELDLESAQARGILAEGMHLGASGTVELAGRIAVQAFTLRAAGATLDGTADADDWGAVLQASIELAAPDLVLLGVALGQDLAGSLHAKAHLDLNEDEFRGTVSGVAADLATGIAAIDALLGPAPAFSAEAQRNSDGEVLLPLFNLNGSALRVDATGRMTGEHLDFSGTAGIDNLTALDPSARGALSLSAHLAGTRNAPELQARLASVELVYGETVARNLALDVSAKNLATDLQATISGGGNLAGQPMKLAMVIATEPETGAVRVDDLALRHGTSAMSGNLRLLEGVADGSVSLAMADLASYAPMIGTALDGSAIGKVNLVRRNGLQDVTLDLSVEELVVGEGLQIASIDLAATVADVSGGRTIDASLAAADFRTDAATFETVQLTARGDLIALDIDLTAVGPEARIDLAAKIAEEPDGLSATLSQFAAEIQGQRLALQGPAQLVKRGDDTLITGVRLAHGEGGVTFDGRFGPGGNDMRLTVSRLSLGLLQMMDPALAVAGEINGTASLAGSHRDPVAQADISALGVSLGGQSDLLIDVGVTGDWRNGMLDVAGDLDFSTGGSLDLAASLGVPADAATGLPRVAGNATLRGKASGDLDLAVADRFLAGGADRVAGKMRIDLAADGTLSEPRLTGNVVLSEGRYENLRYGVKLAQLTAELRGNGERIDLVSLSARTPGGGQLAGSGSLGLQGDMPVQVMVSLDQAQVINTDTAFAIADARLDLAGDLAEALALTGNVTVRKAELRIPDNLPPSVQEIAFVEVNMPPERARQVEAEAKGPPKTLAIALDLRIDIPQQMFVRGRGLDAELGGAMTVTGTADQPIVLGDIAMRRGTFDLVGRRLEFSRGQVAFDGGEKIDPLLDFVANAKAENYDVAVNVGGRASLPKITLSSTPALPEDEVLSRLLFGKASGSLTALEALQLAQAAAELAGVNTGVGMLDAIRGKAGLDRLSVDAGDGTAGPSLSAGRYVGDGVYVGVKQGAGANSSAATVEIEVTPNVKVETELGADSSKAGVNWEWDY